MMFPTAHEVASHHAAAAPAGKPLRVVEVNQQGEVKVTTYETRDLQGFVNAGHTQQAMSSDLLRQVMAHPDSPAVGSIMFDPRNAATAPDLMNQLNAMSAEGVITPEMQAAATQEYARATGKPHSTHDVHGDKKKDESPLIGMPQDGALNLAPLGGVEAPAAATHHSAHGAPAAHPRHPSAPHAATPSHHPTRPVLGAQTAALAAERGSGDPAADLSWNR